MTHTASRKNPYDALADHASQSNRAYERGWKPRTELAIDEWAVEWGVPRTVTEALLNFEQLESAACRYVSLDNLGDLARWVEEYATKRQAEGQMTERERYQEQGE